jgi:hypothetical protein
MINTTPPASVVNEQNTNMCMCTYEYRERWWNYTVRGNEYWRKIRLLANLFYFRIWKSRDLSLCTESACFLQTPKFIIIIIYCNWVFTQILRSSPVECGEYCLFREMPWSQILIYSVSEERAARKYHLHDSLPKIRFNIIVHIYADLQSGFLPPGIPAVCVYLVLPTHLPLSRTTHFTYFFLV